MSPRKSPLLSESWLIDKLASRADYEKFINASCDAPSQTQASKLCINQPQLFFTYRHPRQDKLSGGSGWGRAAQEIKKLHKKQGELFKQALITEIQKRRKER